MGSLRKGAASTTSFDLIASNDVLALATGPLSVAVGLSARREEVTQTSSPALESGDILNLSATPSLSGARDILALFVETNIPLATTVEVNLAARYDHYSDFGGSTNPQVSLRWQPAATLMLRGSAGTGYFAPSLPALFQPPVYGITPGNLSDPARCPTTHSPQDCNTQFPQLGGGNPALQPTTSKQWSVGGVWAPTRELSLGLDYVSILLDDRVESLSRPADLRAMPQRRHRPDVLPHSPRASRSHLSDTSWTHRPGRPVSDQLGQAESHRHRFQLSIQGAKAGLGVSSS